MDATRRRNRSFASTLVTLLLGWVCLIPAHAEQPGADPRRISGRVVSEAGEPLAGARVYLAPKNRRYEYYPHVAKPEEPLRVRAVTDSDGRFDFLAEDAVFTDLDGLPTAHFCEIYAEADGYGIDWLRFNKLSRGSSFYRDDAGRNLTLRLPIDDTPVRARLVDQDGLPLAGLRVIAYSIRIPKNRDLDAELALARRLAAQAKKNPWAGVGAQTPSYNNLVLRLNSNSLPPTVQAATRTDADGWFTLTGFGSDRFVDLRVEGPGIKTHWLGVTTRQVSDEVTSGSGRTMELSPDRRLRGRVVDAGTGEPIAGMQVGLGHRSNGVGHPDQGIRSNETVSDADGWFTLVGIDPEWRELFVTAESPPGGTYLPAGSMTSEETLAFGNPVLITCQRGVPSIPFRLTLTDAAGRPVEGEVTYNKIYPNPHTKHAVRLPTNSPAVPRGDGVFEGLALPGPGAVLVRTRGRTHRVAFVDPKGFFEPGRSDWTTKERFHYGDQTRIQTGGRRSSQLYYAAVVLVNPEPGSGPLELQATLYPNRPKQMTLRDAKGEPLTGVTVRGLLPRSEYSSAPLRTATLTLDRLHPERETPLLLRHKERKLAGFLSVRGGSDTRLSAQLAPWGVLEGRVLNEEGEPLKKLSVTLDGDAVIGYLGAKTNSRGEFRLEGLVPNETYDLSVSPSHDLTYGTVAPTLTLTPGETRDLGDLRVGPLKER